MIQNIFDVIKHWLKQFSKSQLLYILAILVLIINGLSAAEGGDDDEVIFLPGLIAIAGLAIDIWPKFVTLWNTMLGRICIVTVYVILANFAVAMAAQKVNQIVGIDPSSMFYTLGFVTLLMAPIWFIVVTVIGMLFYMFVTQVVFLVAIFFSLIRVKLNVSFNSLIFPKTTMLLKLILVPVMLASLMVILKAYGSEFAQISVFTEEEIESTIEKNIDPNTKSVDTLAISHTEKNQQQSSSNMLDTDKLTAENDPTPEQLEAINPLISKDMSSRMDKVIAKFVYWIEGFEFSQCIKADQERFLFVGESDILIITPNKESPLAYDFSVKTCQLTSSLAVE